MQEMRAHLQKMYVVFGKIKAKMQLNVNILQKREIVLAFFDSLWYNIHHGAFLKTRI